MLTTEEKTGISRLYQRYRSFDLVVNSRLVTRAAETLFFALPGQRRDGHEFVPELIRAGVRHFVLSRHVMDTYRHAIEQAVRETEGKTDPLLVLVDEPALMLRELAAYHRSQFAIPVIAITGSNGKTIVKDWLRQLLSVRYRVCASPRSYNSKIGVPLSLWRIEEGHQIAVIEVGISQPGDMEMLRRIVRPTHGVLTMVGQAHRANFASRAALVREKLGLFPDVHQLIVANNDAGVLAVARATVAGGKVYAWEGQGRRGIVVGEEHADVVLPALPGIYLDNARTAAAAAYKLANIPWVELQPPLRRLLPLANRLEQRQGADDNIVINDSYSNDFTALGAALEFAEIQDTYGRITLILGTLQRGEALRKELQQLLRHRIQELYLVGPDNAGLLETFPGAVYYPSVDSLLDQLPELDMSRRTVLVKGASYENFVQLADVLSRQRHRTVLRVDLDALRHNLNTYRQRLPAGTGMMVMAKASAYGSGSSPVARMLQDAGVAYLAVAYPEEGCELRRAGIHLPIVVLNAEAYTYAMLAEYGLEPVVHRTEDLRRAAALDLRVHLELDTGMGRLGFSTPEFLAFCTQPDVQLRNSVATIFSHLAASDDPIHDRFTAGQIDRFNELYDSYLAGDTATGTKRVQRHLLNTNGISRFPRAAYDMVRLGIGLFGLGDEALAMNLQPGLSLTTTVAALSDRVAGQTVGYGRRGVMPHDGRVAVLSIGYADGLPRLAGRGRYMLRIRNRLVPTIGSICMDMCTVDVTDMPEVRVGDEVTVFGPDHPIEMLAEAAQTIPYEILTGIGNRVHRIYLGQ